MVKKSSLLDYASKIKGETKLTQRQIIARVAGVTFEGRQEKIAKIQKDTEIRLERDRRNEYDFYAVKVLALLDGVWEHVGFLPKAMSKKVSESLDGGQELKAWVARKKGGGRRVPYDPSSVDTSKDIQFSEVINYGLDIIIEGQLL